MGYPHVSRIFDPEKLKHRINCGHVTSQVHPSLPLTIYNYTSKAQFDNLWDDVTTNCRGLILNDSMEIVGRCMKKFHNIEDYAPHELKTHGPYRVLEKVDGSLILLCTYEGELVFSSRGSFTSDQAVMAQNIYTSKYKKLFAPMPEYTYHFEVIYPANRIVVNYGDLEDLVFLTAIHNGTGASAYNFSQNADWPGLRAQEYPYADLDLMHMKHDLAEDNAEGFVLYFPQTEFRCKVKFEEYLRLHRVMFNVSTKTIWSMLAKEQDFSAILDRIPDEMYNWIKAKQTEYKDAYRKIYDDAKWIYDGIIQDLSPGHARRDFMVQAYKHECWEMLIHMYDSNDASLKKAIWNRIKPKYERPVLLGYSNELVEE